MSQLSFPSFESTLLVRDAHGRYLPASADDILEAARQVIDQKMQRGTLFDAPTTVKTYLPPEESRARAAKLLYENTPTAGVDWRERLTAFVGETGRIIDLLDGVMPEIDWLDDAETLTYLHATVSTRHYRLGVPAVPFHLDALLADMPLVGGLAPML